jgi:hypothetical protein
MNPELSFSMALGIYPPWEIEGIEFAKEAKRLDIKIGVEASMEASPRQNL